MPAPLTQEEIYPHIMPAPLMWDGTYHPCIMLRQIRYPCVMPAPLTQEEIHPHVMPAPLMWDGTCHPCIILQHLIQEEIYPHVMPAPLTWDGTCHPAINSLYTAKEEFMSMNSLYATREEFMSMSTPDKEYTTKEEITIKKTSTQSIKIILKKILTQPTKIKKIEKEMSKNGTPWRIWTDTHWTHYTTKNPSILLIILDIRTLKNYVRHHLPV